MTDLTDRTLAALFGLKSVDRAGLIPSKKLEPDEAETNERIAIFVAMIKKWGKP